LSIENGLQIRRVFLLPKLHRASDLLKIKLVTNKYLEPDASDGPFRLSSSEVLKNQSLNLLATCQPIKGKIAQTPLYNPLYMQRGP